MMLFNLGLLVAFASATSALLLNTPTDGWATGSQQTITWESNSIDPKSFSLLIKSIQLGNSETLALAASLTTSNDSYTLTVPNLSPGNGWSLIAVNNFNENQVYSQTGLFTVYPS